MNHLLPTSMYTMTDMLDAEHDAIMKYCEDIMNEWRTHYSPNKAAAAKRQKMRVLEATARAWACNIPVTHGVR